MMWLNQREIKFMAFFIMIVWLNQMFIFVLFQRKEKKRRPGLVAVNLFQCQDVLFFLGLQKNTQEFSSKCNFDRNVDV